MAKIMFAAYARGKRMKATKSQAWIVLLTMILIFAAQAAFGANLGQVKFIGADRMLFKATLELWQSVQERNFQGYLNVLFNLEADRIPFFKDYAALTGHDPYKEFRNEREIELLKDTYSRQPSNLDNLRRKFAELSKGIGLSAGGRLLQVEDMGGGAGYMPGTLARFSRVFFQVQDRVRFSVLLFVRVQGRWKLLEFVSGGPCEWSDIEKFAKSGFTTLAPMELNTLKLNATMARMKALGYALDSYITDMAKVPDCLANDWECLRKVLTPFYAREIATTDAWGNPLYFFFGSQANGNSDCYEIIAAGANGKMEVAPGEFLVDRGAYDGRFDIRGEADFNHDIVYANGSFMVMPLVKEN